MSKRARSSDLRIRVTGNPEVDAELTENPFALLSAMLLDQQVPMERAFAGPHTIAARMAEDGLGRFEPGTVERIDPEVFAELCSRKPAVHRFPSAMAQRIVALAQQLSDDYNGDAARIWTDPGDARAVLRRIKALPGFGQAKATIFLALIGKQLGVRPEGWAEVVGELGTDGHRSVADVVDADSLTRVREHKAEVKRAARAAEGDDA